MTGRHRWPTDSAPKYRTCFSPSGVSPQSRGRKRKKSGARGRNEPLGPDAVIASTAQSAIRELESGGDALDAELYVSELFGVWWGQFHGLADPDVLLGEGLVAHAARRKRAGAVGLLRVLRSEVDAEKIRKVFRQMKDVVKEAGKLFWRSLTQRQA